MFSDSDSTDARSLFFCLVVFWVLLYALRESLLRARRISALPSLTSSARAPSTELFRSSCTRITLDRCHLRYQSTAWNALHQSSLARLAKRGDWRRALQGAYDVGSVLGILGMLGSVSLLLWTTAQLFASVYNSSTTSSPVVPTANIRKRDTFAVEQSSTDLGSKAALQLIIPGLTTPLHHLPLLLVALLTAQVVHECGHAVAAALDGVPLTSAGLGLTVILPSAFVAFPTEETESLPLRSRTRLISAGAFHNLMFWLVLSAAAWLGTSALVWPVLGYRDVGQYGRVVVGVDEMSPLYGHLPVGAVIYKVGDDALASPKGAATKWETLLSPGSSRIPRSLGWCAETSWFTAQDVSCCTTRRSTVSSQSCFATVGESRLEHCVDPLRFLQPAETESMRRCASAAECGHDHSCVRPRGDQELLSLTMYLPPWMRTDGGDAERTVVWQGDRSEILEEVDVGDWLPRSSWLPMGLPFLWATFYSYLKMLTLSLYFFNLLPLPFLDGGQLFDVLHDAWAAHRTPELDVVPLSRMEEGEEGRSPIENSSLGRATQEKKAHFRRAHPGSSLPVLGPSEHAKAHCSLSRLCHDGEEVQSLRDLDKPSIRCTRYSTPPLLAGGLPH
ncbi:hypothetical protein C8Q77DRAFT_1108050 [Trametes polyzona]|nr:hypothetical protein C8Q77DRAFT_1108050 [Trametes polyzona]